MPLSESATTPVNAQGVANKNSRRTGAVFPAGNTKVTRL
jgi:hypothetical protein